MHGALRVLLFEIPSLDATNSSEIRLDGYAEAAILGNASLSEGNYTSGFNETDEEVWDKFILPWWRQLIWSILFALMIIVSTGGNLIIIWIVLTNKRMRTVTNYFLVNLSIADTMVSTLNVTFNYTYMLNSDWPFGYLYCKINQFVAVITICASVFTLMAISIDRYMAIMNPLRPRMGRKMTLGIAVGIWLVGIALSIPNLIFYTLEVVKFEEGHERRVCYMIWPDGPTNESIQEYWYNVIFMLLTYVLPIGSMTFTYTKIGLELWGSQSIGECTQRQLENIKSKRRVVKMMIVVVVIFMLCWLPFHTYFILTSHFPEVTQSSYIQEVYLAIYWLAMSNAMYNPIIYCWMNSRGMLLPIPVPLRKGTLRRGIPIKPLGWHPELSLEEQLLPQAATSITPRHPQLEVSPRSKEGSGPLTGSSPDSSWFRRGFKEIFSWCPCVEVGPGLLSRREPVTARYSVSGSPEAACRILRNGTVHIPLQPTKGNFSSKHRTNKKIKSNGTEDFFSRENS